MIVATFLLMLFAYSGLTVTPMTSSLTFRVRVRVRVRIRARITRRLAPDVIVLTLP